MAENKGFCPGTLCYKNLWDSSEKKRMQNPTVKMRFDFGCGDKAVPQKRRMKMQ
tara:strand:- start:793 stop:954 length:162 start_codon:yes stop_codon:yes gene_type:complete